MPNTREKAAKWFADRAAITPMPGARAMFEIAADALQEKTVQEWISVKDRLPEQCKDVLVYTITHDIRKAHCYGDRQWFAHDGIWRSVTHWMPLPEAPKGE